ncbi:hypothetical protein TSMEX_003539, partial [Taenia solium]
APSPSPEGKGLSQTASAPAARDEPPAAPVVSEPVVHHRTPTLTKCPNCEAEVVSNVTYRNGLCVWLSCAGCVAIG